MTTILTTAVFKKKGTQTMTAIKYINNCYRYSGGSSSSTLIKTAGAAWVGYQVGIIIVIMITRSSWLNCALRDDEAVYWVSIGHYEAVAVGN